MKSKILALQVLKNINPRMTNEDGGIWLHEALLPDLVSAISTPWTLWLSFAPQAPRGQQVTNSTQLVPTQPSPSLLAIGTQPISGEVGHEKHVPIQQISIAPPPLSPQSSDWTLALLHACPMIPMIALR